MPIPVCLETTRIGYRPSPAHPSPSSHRGPLFFMSVTAIPEWRMPVKVPPPGALEHAHAEWYRTLRFQEHDTSIRVAYAKDEYLGFEPCDASWYDIQRGNDLAANQFVARIQGGD